LAPSFRFLDRQGASQIELDRHQYLEFTRQLADMSSARIDVRTIATRGDRLLLSRTRLMVADGDVGPSELDYLNVVETDPQGRYLAMVRFAADDLDAAYAELDARWPAGEAAAHPLASKWIADYERFFAGRDWTGMAAIMAPDLVSHSHRLVSWGTLHGPSGLVSTMEVQMALAPDTRLRLDHVRTCAGGLLLEYTWLGTREGGAFENLLVAAIEIDAFGRARRVDVWEAEKLEQAQARFEALSATPEAPAAIAKPNVPLARLTSWLAVFDAAIASNDWDAMRDHCAAGMIFEDRRRLALLSGDLDLMIASARERARGGGRPEFRVKGTAGDRVAVSRVLWSGGPPEGRWEVEYLSVVETDEVGKIAAMIFFDLDDDRAAQREAWARWVAIDPMAAELLGVNEGDTVWSVAR
jgi:hypothetical protein